MAIELQNTPPGNHRVVGGHRQGSKAADSGQAGNALGFAALMSLVSDPESVSDTGAEGAGLTLISAGFEDKSALADVNELVVAGQLKDGAVPALSISSPTPGVPTISDAGPPTLGSNIAVGPLLQSSIANRRMGSGRPVDASNTPVLGSQLSQTQTPTASQLEVSNTATVPVAAQSSSIAAIQLAVGESQGDAQSAQTAMNSFTSALAVSGRQPQFIGSEGESPSALPQVLATVPLGPMDTISTPIQVEKTPSTAQRLLVDLAKIETAAKQAPITKEPTAQVASLSAGQTMDSGMDAESISVVSPKAGGIGTSQQISLAGQVRHDATELAFRANATGAVTLPGHILAVSQQDAGVRALERPMKHQLNLFGSGAEGVYGQPLASANPADLMFQVVPTSAAAASTVVAETVSYWASQGIHSASLQLDGFGDEPVEVRISVNGDMTQVDFRTNQPEVRQIIEAAASQLKDMLTSQGMQLAGLSIGTSGRGGSQEKGPRQTPESRKAALMKPEVVEAPRLRGANPSVGQALDLFV